MQKIADMWLKNPFFRFALLIGVIILLILKLPSIYPIFRINQGYLGVINYWQNGNRSLFEKTNLQLDLITKLGSCKSAEGYVGLGYLSLANNDLTNASLFFEQALSIKSDPILQFQLGMIWDQLGDRPRCLDYWRKAGAEVRFTTEGLYYLNQVLDWGKAREKFELALAINPDWMPAKTVLTGMLRERALENIKQGRPGESIPLLLRVIELIPSGLDYAYLGDQYLQVGDAESAFIWYNNGLEKYPQNAIFYQRIGKFYAEKVEYASAQAWLEKAIDYDPSFAPTYYWLGMVFLNQGYLSEAQGAFLKRLSLEPHAWTYARLGDVYLAEGSLENAIWAYNSALDLDPGLGYAQQRLDEITSFPPTP